MKKISKAAAALFILCASVFAMSVTAHAEFVKTDDGMKFSVKGKYVTGKTYTYKGKTYYFNEDGIMTTGFVKIRKDTYYFDKDGVMQTGLKKIGKDTYYFYSSGKMCTEMIMLKDKIYIFGKDGKAGSMPTGLVTYKGDEYCCKNGKILKGLQEITTGGKTKKYFFSYDTGKMIKGEEVEYGLYRYNINAKGEVISAKDITQWMFKRRKELKEKLDDLDIKITALSEKIDALKLECRFYEASQYEAQLGTYCAEYNRCRGEYDKIIKNLNIGGFTVLP